MYEDTLSLSNQYCNFSISFSGMFHSILWVQMAISALDRLLSSSAKMFTLWPLGDIVYQVSIKVWVRGIYKIENE